MRSGCHKYLFDSWNYRIVMYFVNHPNITYHHNENQKLKQEKNHGTQRHMLVNKFRIHVERREFIEEFERCYDEIL